MLSPLDPFFGNHHFLLVHRKGTSVMIRWLDPIQVNAFEPGEKPSCALFLRKMKEVLSETWEEEGRLQLYHLHPKLVAEYGEV